MGAKPYGRPGLASRGATAWRTPLPCIPPGDQGGNKHRGVEMPKVGNVHYPYTASGKKAAAAARKKKRKTRPKPKRK
tara:strand:+ start:837 stop:1067 length:231 start_codon:yes stop_codon:yes gene_type:complete